MLRCGCRRKNRERIRVLELQAALSRIQATDVLVPGTWDGVSLEANISPGIVADHGWFSLGQRLPLEFLAPDDFPVDRFMEVLFRHGGMNAGAATAVAKRFHGRPADFLHVDPRYRITHVEVQVASRTGVLLRYLPDRGLERLSLIWNVPDRAYFLTGALTEVEALAIANSLK